MEGKKPICELNREPELENTKQFTRHSIYICRRKVLYKTRKCLYAFGRKSIVLFTAKPVNTMQKFTRVCVCYTGKNIGISTEVKVYENTVKRSLCGTR